MKQKVGYEFDIVRALCQACGWQRKIGYTGSGWYRVAGIPGTTDIRAVIRLKKSRDPRLVLQCDVLEFPPQVSLDEIKSKYPEFRDLQAEADEKGMLRTMEEFQPLLEGERCPRCKQEGQVRLDSLGLPGEELKYLGRVRASQKKREPPLAADQNQ